MIKFNAIKNDNIIYGETKYFEMDRSFDFVPKQDVDINIAISYLNLGFDSDNMKAKCVWGFSPKESWNNISDIQPESFLGELFLLGEYESGLTWRIDKEEMWKSYYNNETGWFCIGDKNQEANDINIQFATDIIAVLQSETLKALWFKPDFVE